MAERWVVLGGWSFSPEILRPLFGEDAVLIDTNLLMPRLVSGDSLSDNWQERALEYVHPLLPSPPFALAGWSTGAIVAWALASRLRPSHLAMLSATPSFCRGPGFRCGTRPAVLDRMRTALLDNPEPVLESFTERCGLVDTEVRRDYTAETLAAGLVFLRDACLLPVEPLPVPVSFFHGSHDRIVPIQAGRAFAGMVCAKVRETSGGHGFVVENAERMSKLLFVSASTKPGGKAVADCDISGS